VLEFLTSEGKAWVIDSATSADSLEPLATSLADIVGVGVQRAGEG
jgi:hypothetical protein